jgi:hypothetical protein
LAPATTADTTGTSDAGAALESTLVLASPSGVEIIPASGDSTEISTRAAATAYAVGTDLVVFQDAEASGGVFPPRGAGAVMSWSGGEVSSLPIDPDASRVFLLDLAVVDGATVVLVAERFGEVRPDDTFEALVRIDLRDGSRTTIVRRPAWESGHSAARLLPDGDVIGLLTSEAQLLAARWSPMSEEALWTVEVGVDTSRDLTLRNGTITLIQSSFDSARGYTPVLDVTTLDETNGEIETGLFCRDWVSGSTLVCGRGGGVAISVSVEDGSFGLLPGETASIPTVVRSS